MLNWQGIVAPNTSGFQYVNQAATTVIDGRGGGSLHELGSNGFIMLASPMLRWRSTDPGARDAARFTRNMVDDAEG